MMFNKYLLLAAGTMAAFFTTKVHAQQKNVLLIVVDDLRPELGCYGNSIIKSPNIDKLASSGVRFNRAYCNVPVCGASRASLMSGIRPNPSRFINAGTWLDIDVPGVLSLPMHFRNNGYQTISLGKVFHNQDDSKGSWETNWRPQKSVGGSPQGYQLPSNIAKDKGDNIRGLPYERADVPDEAYSDGILAEKAIEAIQASQKNDRPFFLAVGFSKPHLPFRAPAKYWDLYPEGSINLPENMCKPKDAPDAAMHNFGELRTYSDIPKIGPVSPEMALKLKHGYYACVSYVDAQIGKVMQALENAGLAENTIVVILGDHGWQLGEHGLWCKHCNFEKVLHSPLIIKAPGYKAGVVVEKLAEYVDVYPTLCELAGIAQPFHLQGNSLTGFFDGGNPPWKNEIFCRWMKGETIISNTHAYTEWYEAKEKEPYARMLYNHTKDAEENINISEHPENKQMVYELHNLLLEHIRERELIKLTKNKANK